MRVGQRGDNFYAVAVGLEGATTLLSTEDPP